MNAKLSAYLRMGVGSAKVVSGVALFTGHGVLAHLICRGRVPPAAVNYALHSVRDGMRMVKEGSEDLKRSHVH